MNIHEATSAYTAFSTQTNAQRKTTQTETTTENVSEGQDIFIGQAQSQTDTVRDTARKQARQQTEQSERRDEFVQSSNIVIRNAVYNISDVAPENVHTVQKQVNTGQYVSSGKRINRKILDMLLPLGRKRLSIYSTKA